ncbi:MAG: hypothetical protein IJP80_02950 [Bacteroidales bacterium]|nr:hypothetical protein [Bacteroidales bacterium]
MTRYRHLSVAVPVLAEFENLPSLFESLESQTFSDFDVYICVNNRESWSCSMSEREQAMYHDNQKSIEWLRRHREHCPNLHILDYSSPTKGWAGKSGGVGWARKVLLDAIATEHDEDELVVSLDADTGFEAGYFETVLSVMNRQSDGSCLAVPYYHPLSGDETCDRAMLRYEAYMRYYFVNLFGIRQLVPSFPYVFTALGSAMVFPLWAYGRLGGITPLQGGEDFYLMQKFAKTGKVLLSCNEVVKPQGRASMRVPFGTGPAIAKGVDSMDDGYPFYPMEAFEAVAATFSLFPSLYDGDVETPMTAFLCSQLKTSGLWQPLRRNFKTREHFVHACQERVDGLRILQYLRYSRERMSEDCTSPEEEFGRFCNRHGISLPSGFGFRHSPIETIDSLRDALFGLEMSLRSQC